MTSVFKSKTLVYIIPFGMVTLFFFFKFISTAAFEISFLLYLQFGFRGVHMFTLPVLNKAQYSHNLFRIHRYYQALQPC